MARGMPSMVALLGLLAVAGYQNRDKIAAALGGANRGPGGVPAPGGATPPAQADQGGLLEKLGGLAGGAGLGSVISGGLGDLIDRFRQNGHADTADSWVKTGPNKPLAANQLEQAIGSETLDELAQHTGLSRDELLARLTRDIPQAVDKYTPDGRLPTEAEAGRLV